MTESVRYSICIYFHNLTPPSAPPEFCTKTHSRAGKSAEITGPPASAIRYYAGIQAANELPFVKNVENRFINYLQKQYSGYIISHIVSLINKLNVFFDGYCRNFRDNKITSILFGEKHAEITRFSKPFYCVVCKARIGFLRGGRAFFTACRRDET